MACRAEATGDEEFNDLDWTVRFEGAGPGFEEKGGDGEAKALVCCMCFLMFLLLSSCFLKGYLRSGLEFCHGLLVFLVVFAGFSETF